MTEETPATGASEPPPEPAAPPPPFEPAVAPPPPPAAPAGAQATPPGSYAGPAYASRPGPFVPVPRAPREPWVNPSRRTPAFLLALLAAVVLLGAGIGIGVGIGSSGHSGRGMYRVGPGGYGRQGFGLVGPPCRPMPRRYCAYQRPGAVVPGGQGTTVTVPAPSVPTVTPPATPTVAPTRRHRGGR